MILLGFVLLLCGTSAVIVGLRLATLEGSFGALLGMTGLVLAALIFTRGRRGLLRVSPGRVSDLRFLAILAAWAFALRLVAAMALHTEARLWVYMGGDEATFHASAICFSNYVDGRYPVPVAPRFVGTKEVGFFYLLGCIYYILGIGKAIPLVVTAAVGACTVYPVHALAARLGGREAARRAALLVAFFPSLILWSALLVRDTYVLFFLVAALLAADHVRRRLSPVWILALLASLGALSTLRSYIFLIAAAGIGAGLVLGRRNVVTSVVTGAVVMGAVLLLVRNTGVGASHLELANLETVSQLRQWNALGPSASGSLGSDIDISTPTAALTYLPLGMVYFLFSPLPWQIGSPRQFMAVLDLVVWYSMIPGILTGFLFLFRKRPRAALPVLFAVGGITLLYSLVEGNIGIIFRHRAQIIVPLCAMAGVGWAVKRRALRKEKSALEGPVPVHPAPGGAVRPSTGL